MMKDTSSSSNNNSNNNNNKKKNPTALIHQARTIWLEQCDIQKAKKLYLEALVRSKQNHHTCQESHDGHDYDIQKKKRKRGGDDHKSRKALALNVLTSEQTRDVIEKIALLLIQSGKVEKAKASLKGLGYTCRLSRQVLDYPMDQGTLQSSSSSSSRIMKKSDAPCMIIDNFLTKYEERILSSTFRDPDASYWKDHSYQIEPPSPYFSYVIPVDEVENYGFVGKLAQDVLQCKLLRKKFPKMKNAKFIEMWAHNRPHPSGHQCHFDSDDEGAGGVRNPIISTILYVSADSGGPSVVTTQRLDHHHLAERGYLSHPVRKRLVAFDGKVLHGVVPGKGKSPVSGGRRVTVMFAFWKHIQIRHENAPGSARSFPLNSSLRWVKQLLSFDDGNYTENKREKTRLNMQESQPIEVDCVYETLDGIKWSKDMGLPEYDQVYQGF